MTAWIFHARKHQKLTSIPHVNFFVIPFYFISSFMLGLNNVIRELVHSLYFLYGANTVYGIQGGFHGFHDPLYPPIHLTNDVSSSIIFPLFFYIPHPKKSFCNRDAFWFSCGAIIVDLSLTLFFCVAT